MKKYRLLILIIGFFVCIAAIMLGIFTLLLKPVNILDKTKIIFVVPKGEAIKSIGARLEQQGLIKNQLVFVIEVKRLGLSNKIQAGDFRLSKNLSTDEIAQELTHGSLDVWIQVIEGLRADEIAEILKKDMPTYENSWVLQLRKQEGHLFPDTYLIPKDAGIDLILTAFKTNFDKKIASLQANVGTNGLTLDQSIILASIVEREALFEQDRGIIAGILLNRLDLGMALQADATVQYALGYQPQENDWWKKSLTREDLLINSPYNTYKFAGLPPGPIASPGLASITAVLNPTKTDYLYYLHDSKGKTHYAKTLEEHNANIAKYL